MTLVNIVYASTSGHTEYVVDLIGKHLRVVDRGIDVEARRAEATTPDDLLRGDLLIFGSGTWNTGGIEGQLNMYMHRLLMEQAAHVDLAGKRTTCISLGDDRYYYTTRCTEHLLRYVREHNGRMFGSPLVLVNEPYGKEEKIRAWAARLAEALVPAASPAS